IICLIAWHHVLGPVHTGFHVLFAAGLAYAMWDRYRAWRSGGRLLPLLDSRVPSAGGQFWSASHAAGVDPWRVRVVGGLPVPAFTAGWLRPRIYLSASLDDQLSQEQLTAVIAHEAAHVARRDPLRLSVLRFLARMVFWIPALGRLAADAANEAEIRADDAAAARSGPLVLASAILELAKWNTGPARAADATGRVGFHPTDMLDRRVRRLAGEPTPVESHITRASLVAAAAALMLAWASGVVVAHPLPEMSQYSHAEHCAHHSTPAMAHLLCGSEVRQALRDA
ncbi:MAG TPA: M56 family metallopeptidase, partial [Longimicrobiaceae bacterium]|nr:M56 family metallopeptidase [Longimicrobiaceae bacterium]